MFFGRMKVGEIGTARDAISYALLLLGTPATADVTIKATFMINLCAAKYNTPTVRREFLFIGICAVTAR
jgi:hypothetical protein